MGSQHGISIKVESRAFQVAFRFSGAAVALLGIGFFLGKLLG